MSAVIDNDYVDCVISNCVINLIPNKYNAFSEIYRVLNQMEVVYVYLILH